MRNSLALVALAALTACSTNPAVQGVASDGETFTGVAAATGMWDTSGTLQLVSNRGASCIGRFVFDGIAGPRGKATFACNDGRTGEAELAMIGGVNRGTGTGTIGAQRITFTFGPP